MTFTPYIWPLLVAAAFCVATAAYSRRYPDVPAVGPFVIMMWLGVAWSLIYALSLCVVELRARIFVSNLMYVPTRLISVAIFMLVVEYTGRERWLSRRNVALLLILPVVAIFASLSSPLHHLFRYDFHLVKVGALTLLYYKGGILYWITSTYGDLLQVFALALLFFSLRAPNLHAWNTVSIIIGLIAPGIMNVLFNLGLTPIKGFSFAPAATAVTGAAYLWAMHRYRLFGVVPVARSTVMDNLSDPVVVLDQRGHIVDFNGSAAEVLGLDARRSVGEKLDSLSPEWEACLGRCSHGPSCREEVTANVGGQERIFDLSASALADSRSRPVGRLFLLHDITDRRLAERKVQNLLSEKELLLIEVHHRIKNNMSVISSILSLHADALRGTPAREALLDARSRVLSMMLLYDRLYRASGVNDVSIAAYLTPLVEKVVENFAQVPSVELRTDVADFQVGARTLFPIGIITNELITNAMKHAFNGRSGGVLEVAARLEDGEVVVRVRDNGPGLEDASLELLTRPDGEGPADVQAGKGFGLQLVHVMLNQVGGRLEARREGGTEITMRFDRW